MSADIVRQPLTTPDTTRKYAKSGSLKRDLTRDKYLYFLLIPFVLFYILFEYLPLYGILAAFKDFRIFKGIWASDWVGFENFERFFTGPYFWRIVRNTLMINVYSLIFGFPVPIILAILFNEVRNIKYKKFVQTAMYLPHSISIVVIAGIITTMLGPYNGLVNIVLERIGIEKIHFLMQPQWFRPIYVGSGIWQEAGYQAIIYLAALSAIDPSLYESAVIDGANKWRQIIHITLPGILPTIVILLILKIGRMLDLGYQKIILLYQPATYETSDVIQSYVYRMGLQVGEYAISATASVFNGVVAFILVVMANSLSKRVSNEGLW